MQIRLTLIKLKKVLTKLDTDDCLALQEQFGVSSNTKNTTQITISFKDLKKDLAEKLAELLLEHCELTANQRLGIGNFLNRYSFKNLDGLTFLTAKELHEHLKHLNGRGAVANVAVKIGPRAYPAHARISFWTHEEASACNVEVHFNYGHYPDIESERIYAAYYTPPVAEMSDWDREPINLLNWLAEHKIVPLTSEIIEETSRKLEKLDQVKQKVQMICTGSCVKVSRSWYGSSIEDCHFGSILHPEKVIVDSSFESEGGDDYRSNLNFPMLPLVRVFSLRTKSYVLVDVDDLDTYIYDTNAISRLVVPEKTRNLLTNIFNKREELFADVVSGKHGGLVILANGSPGVGKTLTAEIMAEYTQRPLYVMELGELGTNLASVEASLQNIFSRVTRWNCLLLFDEADIFLHERDDNLERSAIVGIFLRLLDYFPGIMFLTTNRMDVLDKAVKSRVTVRLDYPDLDSQAREKIWKVMFRMINRDPEHLVKLSELPINGRQIRNLMRLAVTCHGKTVSPEQVYELSDFSTKD